MPDISFDPTSVIRAATDPAAPGSAAAQSKADSTPTFGDHLSRARRSNSPQSPADRAEANQPQSTSSQDPNRDDAAPKASRDDQQKQPQKAPADKQGDPANDAPPADAGASAAAAAANPAPPPPPPAPEKEAIKAAETADTTDAALKAAAASQPGASKAATTSAAATAEQTAAAQATAAAAATTAIPQPAPAPTKEPHPVADQTAGAAETAPINPQLTALIESTAAKAAATKKNAPTTSAAPPTPETPPSNPAVAGTKSSLATKAILAAQTSALSPDVQPGANRASQHSQDDSNAAAGAAAASSAAAIQIIADAPAVKTVESGLDKILSGSTRQAASQLVQDPVAPAPSVSTLQSPSVAPGQLPGNANNFAAGVQAKAGADSPSAATTDADRLRFVQRVARAFQAAGDNGGQVKLRLSPPELGSLQLNITMKDGTMTAHIQAETSSAQNLLLNNLPDLRERLAQQDIRIERFDVDLMDRSPGGMPQTPDQNQNANDFGRRAAPSRSSPVAATTEAVLPVRAASYQGSGGLNVVI